MLTPLKKIKEHSRYLIDRVFARKFAGQILLLIILVVSLTSFGMTAYFFGLFSAENAAVSGIPRNLDRGFLDSLWWSFSQVLFLEMFVPMYGATPVVIAYSLFLSIMGLVAFGILLSLIDHAVDSHIQALRRGETPVLERDHMLVLGWNQKIFSVLRQLACLEPGIKVVILAPLEIKDMQSELQSAGIQNESITIILRSGRPSNLFELDRVALNYARSIIILSTDADDIDTIKMMVLLAAKSDWNGEMPKITAEIVHERNFELAKIASRDKLRIISSAKVISKVIVQSIRNPGVSHIYNELFSIIGNSIHVQQIPECTDISIKDIAYRITDGIPIGITWQKREGGLLKYAAALNPEPDYEVASDEKLIVIAGSLPVHYVPSEVNHQTLSTPRDHSHIKTPRRVLVMGWSDMIFDIMQELDAHASEGTEICIVSVRTPDEASKQISERQEGGFKNLVLQFVEADPADTTPYSKIDLSSFQSIIVPADDTGRGGEDIDTRTLCILLRLWDRRRYEKIHTHIVVEITDESNRGLMAELGVDDIVISSNVVSAQLAQVSLQEVLSPIYRELLSAGGIEISLRPASLYVELGQDYQFNGIIYAAQQRMEIALGFFLSRNNGEVILNPRRDMVWSFGEDDQIVVLAQQIY